MRPWQFEKSWTGYLIAAAGIAATTAMLKLFSSHVNATTVALALLLVVLLIAMKYGARPAVAASLLGVLSFNHYFLPPFGTLAISAPENWIALIAFLVTAITVGQLSARAERRAEEANAGRKEIERLYEELQSAFEKASHAEALKQSEKLKSALLDAVTHDIRTPLTSIKASVSTLLEEVRSTTNGTDGPVTLDFDARSEMLEVIDEECDRMDRFVEGLIELARIEAGELHLRRRWGVIDEIVAMVLKRAEPLTRKHRVEVVIADEIPAVQVDPRAVAEVMFTLIDNAVKYSADGTKILLTAHPVNNDTIQIAIENQGKPIPREIRERVFDKFFRATRDGDTSDRVQPKGTGMGLAVAKGIVEAHGGRIWLEDKQEGVGTRAVFTLPIGDLNTSERSTEVFAEPAFSQESR